MKAIIILIAFLFLIAVAYGLFSNLIDFLRGLKQWEKSMDKRYGTDWRRYKKW